MRTILATIGLITCLTKGYEWYSNYQEMKNENERMKKERDEGDGATR